MGGSALSVSTTRLAASDFHPLAAHLSHSLSQALGGARVLPIPAYGAKADFGDLDLIVEWPETVVPTDPVPPQLARWATTGHAREMVLNGAQVSLDWRPTPQNEAGFQVDLLLTKPEHFNAALAYYSFNDLGNFIGRVAQRMGFVHGHQGLLVYARDREELFAKVTVSQEPDAILDFLGYDPARFRSGFEQLSDMFKYVASGTYFNPDVFDDERNHSARVKARKRPTHQHFYNWLEANQPPARHKWAAITDVAAVAREHNQLWKLACDRFPVARDRLDEAWAARRKKQEQAKERARVGGHRVSEWTGLKDSDLGAMMNRLRGELGTQDQAAQWISERNDDQLKTWVMGHLVTPRSSVRRAPL